MKSVKKNVSMVIAIVLIILFFSLKNEFSSIVHQLSNVSLPFLLLSICCVVIFWMFEALALGVFLRKKDNTYNYLFSFGMTLTTQFFNGITPFSSGGQPMQIYYMRRKNINMHTATNICIQNLTVHQIALVVITTITIIYQSSIGALADTAARKFMWLGFGINVAILLTFYAVSYMPKFNYLISNILLVSLHRIRIVKNIDKQREKLENFIREYHSCTEALLKNKIDFLLAIIYSFFKLIFFNSIVYFIMRSTGVTGIFYITAIMCSVSVISVAALVPSPGASVAMEYAFLMFFGVYISSTKIIAIMLLWRFVTYYLGLIIGFLTSIWLDKVYLPS